MTIEDKPLEKRVFTLAQLKQIVCEVEKDLSFTILEIGALPIEGQPEPFHHLLDVFPQSKIFAFEVDESLCENLNQNSKPGITYYPFALGRTEEERPFYEANHEMCSSLYKPNEKLLSLYESLEVSMLKSVRSVKTISLDHFIKENEIESVDFIKIDVQGAELDVFQGGVHTLKNVVGIVSEVEFIPLYKEQPLFGDVCTFLMENEFMFHKFIGIEGRTLNSIVKNNNPHFFFQQMWSDAVFIKDVFKIPELSSIKMLKLGLLAFIYGSTDVMLKCFEYYDAKKGTEIHKALLDL